MPSPITCFIQHIPPTCNVYVRMQIFTLYGVCGCGLRPWDSFALVNALRQLLLTLTHTWLSEIGFITTYKCFVIVVAYMYIYTCMHYIIVLLLFYRWASLPILKCTECEIFLLCLYSNGSHFTLRNFSSVCSYPPISAYIYWKKSKRGCVISGGLFECFINIVLIKKLLQLI